MKKLFEEKVSGEEIFAGRIIKLQKDIVCLENGKQTTREVVRHQGAVCIAPVTPEGKLVFVRQFRYPFGKVLLELPAGKIDPGETPLQCGMRELSEETGFKGKNFKAMGDLYSTPGFSDENIHLYMCETGERGETNFDEDEFIETYEIDIKEAVRMVMAGEIPDAKTQALVLKVFLSDKQ